MKTLHPEKLNFLVYSQIGADSDMDISEVHKRSILKDKKDHPKQNNQNTNLNLTDFSFISEEPEQEPIDSKKVSEKDDTLK